MVTGLVQISSTGGEVDEKGVLRHVNRVGGKALSEGIYYFSTDDGSQEGAMATGKVVISDEGDKYTYYFDKEGKAYTNRLIKGAIYGVDGKRIEAESGSKYDIVPVDTIKDEKGEVVIPANSLVIVNSNGTVKRNATKVDIDGTEYVVKEYVASPK